MLEASVGLDQIGVDFTGGVRPQMRLIEDRHQMGVHGP